MPERILAIRLRALGDLVLTLPALRALRRGRPQAAIEVLTEARFAPLLEGHADVDQVWAVERTATSTLGLVARLRSRRYALAVDFFGNPRSALVTAACGAAATAGYELRGRRYAYRTRVARVVGTGDGVPEYAAASHLRLATAVGGVADGLDARLDPSPRARAEARALLACAGVDGGGPVVGLVPAGSWSTKTWPLSHLALLARALGAAGWRVLAILGPGEDGAAERLGRLVPGLARLPGCDVGVLAAVIASLAALVGTDSGPRHLAAAFGVPTFTWFGPALPEIWTPRDPRHGYWSTDLPCRGCNRTVCPHWTCLPSLDPAQAIERVLGHLERHVRPAAALGSAAGA